MPLDIERVLADEVLFGDSDDRCIYARTDPRQALVCMDLDEATSPDGESHVTAGIPGWLNVSNLFHGPNLVYCDISDLET